MKTSSMFKALLALVTALSFAGITPNAVADEPHPGQWDSRHHYRRDNYGYWDEHDKYHHFIEWHNHHGYWDNRGATRVFINVD